MSDTSRRTNGVPLPALIGDGRQTHRGRPRRRAGAARARGRTIGVLVTDGESTRWQRTTDVEGLAKLGIVVAAAVGSPLRCTGPRPGSTGCPWGRAAG